LGEEIPTVGIAVDTAHIPLDDPALQALVRANKRALQTIVEQPRLAVDYVASFLGRLTSEEAQRYYERYIGPYFTTGGRVDLNVVQRAVAAVVTELGIPATTVAAATVDQMYLPAL
jgi:ABC-type nitrate/sulfonate/bicarbonate transport system substrate-binding protein